MLAQKVPKPCGRLRQPALGAMVALLTLSVVLPCAYEYAFMERTAKSVWEMTPAERLEEIIIVDDASDPPLERFAAADTYKVRFLRHDEPRGLIGAKKTGADAARGGIVVFFDCHVKPARGRRRNSRMRTVSTQYR